VSDGRYTLGIYLAIGITGAAFGQVKATTTADLAAAVPRYVASPPEKVVIDYGRGGLVAEHNRMYADYRKTHAKVEIRGPCYSACTLVTAYIGKDSLCIGDGAFFAFHAVRSAERRELMPDQTARAYSMQPPEIQRWIDDHGGWHKLPLDGYWTMYDRDLWAMGYPRCSP